MKENKVVPEKYLTPIKKRKVKVQLKQKRVEWRVILIQSYWRGFLARKKMKQKKNNSLSNPLNLTSNPHPNLTSNHSNSIKNENLKIEMNAEEEKLESFQSIPFHDLNRVQFYIDSAVGLPENCTITRVSGQLLKPDRSKVSSIGAVESFSDPRSSATNPNFNLFLSWKGSFF